MPDFQLFRPHSLCLKRFRWLHRDQSEDFHRVILQYVAERPGLFIKWPPSLDTHGFRECKLHSLNVVPLPDRLKSSTAQPNKKKILHPLFADLALDPTNLILGKNTLHISLHSLTHASTLSSPLP